MRFTVACQAVVLKAFQHRFRVRLVVAFGAVGYVTMSVSVAEYALQGCVFKRAGVQVLGYLSMASGTNLITGSSGIIDLAGRVHGVAGHASRVVDELGVRFRVAFGAVRFVTVLRMMALGAGNFRMRTFILYNLFFLLNMATVTPFCESIQIGQTADWGVRISMTGEALRKSRTMSFAMTGSAMGHDITPGYARS